MRDRGIDAGAARRRDGARPQLAHVRGAPRKARTRDRVASTGSSAAATAEITAAPAAPVSASSYGALSNLLDREMKMRFSGLDLSRFARIDLRRYNVLIFPPAMRNTSKT